MDPIVVSLISWGMALLFASAGVHKFTQLSAFREVLESYRLLPSVVARPIAAVLPALEALIALAWLAVPALAAPAAIAMLSVYSLAIFINLRRGRVFLDCGCGFGAGGQGQTLSMWLVIRNLALILAAGAALLPASTRSLAAVDLVVVIAALIVSVFLFATAGQLLQNRSSMNSWRQG